MHFQCPRPKLTQLQARCAASLSASLFILAIYLFITSPRLAYAQELSDSDSPTAAHGADHNWFRVGKDEQEEEAVLLEQQWEEESKRSILLDLLDLDPFDDTQVVPTETQETNDKRQAAATITLPGNNIPTTITIGPDEVQHLVFPSSLVFGPHGEKGKGLPGGFVWFEDVPGAQLDYADSVFDGSPDIEQRDAPQLDERAVPNATVWITINTCSQPSWNGQGVQNISMIPPALTLYASPNQTALGPGVNISDGWNYPLQQGWAGGFINATGDVYIAVSSNSTPPGYTGSWTYSIAGSVDNFYYDVDQGASPLYLVDTDTNSALLVTDNFTQAEPSDAIYKQWMDINPVPFTIFTLNNESYFKVLGIQQSYCALQNNADLIANVSDATNSLSPVQMAMTDRGLGNKPKEQFYIRGLNASTVYFTFLVMEGNSTASGPGVVGGGGKVFTYTNLQTKSDGNCALMFGLDFCDTVAYAVPANPHTYQNATALANFYDNYASQLYTNFSLSLQLIPCNATSASQYSLSQNCTTCAAAYKAWVCAVTIPRCMDFTTEVSYLQPRNMGQPFYNGTSLPTWDLWGGYNPMPGAPFGSIADQQTYITAMASNSSRNPLIDSMVKPGPYAELLPCEDLCYNLVRNCPAALGFVCPFPGRGLEVDYGRRTGPSVLSCNYAGATYQIGASVRTGVPVKLAALAAAVLGAVLVL